MAAISHCYCSSRPNRISLPHSSANRSNRGTLKKGFAIYPGSFDPPTNGHLDLIQRGSQIFDELVVAILRNSEKVPMFSVAERREMLLQLTADLRNVRIDTFDGLMVEYAKSMDASVRAARDSRRERL